ncbi:MAG: mercury transporter MerT [Emcibacter sp.]|nr:mercury transporter MerT [Emcibacter sp.]
MNWLNIKFRKDYLDNTQIKKENLVVGGVLIASFAAISCCILPLALFSVGISGAWISNLTALSPYQPIFIGLSLMLIGYGFYLLQSRAGKKCDTETCDRPIQGRRAYFLLSVSLILIAAALAFPWFVRNFLEN